MTAHPNPAAAGPNSTAARREAKAFRARDAARRYEVGAATFADWLEEQGRTADADAVRSWGPDPLGALLDAALASGAPLPLASGLAGELAAWLCGPRVGPQTVLQAVVTQTAPHQPGAPGWTGGWAVVGPTTYVPGHHSTRGAALAAALAARPEFPALVVVRSRAGTGLTDRAVPVE